MNKGQKLLFLLSIFLFLLAGLIFLLNKEKRERDEKKIKERKERIALLNRDVVSLEKKKDLLLFEKDKILKEMEEQKKRERELAEKKKLLKFWSEKGFQLYKFGHRIFDDKKYLEINIEKGFDDDFVLAPVMAGDSYASLLKKVFYNQWNSFPDKLREKIISLAEKINRLDRKYLKVGMNLVLPASLEVLDYSPFKKKLSNIELREIAKKRDELVLKYWNDFGSAYGNKIFQNRASKDWHHILIIDLARQYFGIYKDGKLIHWGPVSTGRKDFETPPGFYISLWQKYDWYSYTYDAPMWNAVNFTTSGLFTHQGLLPGYPQSHGCPRMLEKDSKMVYDISLNEVFPIIVK